MKQIYSVFFSDRTSGKLLKRFDIPATQVHSRFLWEKIKAEELKKLLRSRDLDESTVKMTEHFSQAVTN
jgi:hypothetical protein